MRLSVITPGVQIWILLLAVICSPFHGHSQDTIPAQPPMTDTTAIGVIPAIEDEILPEPPPTVIPPTQVQPQRPVVRAQEKGNTTALTRLGATSSESDTDEPPLPPNVANHATKSTVDGRRASGQPSADNSLQAVPHSDSMVYAAYMGAVRAYYQGREQKYRLNDSLRALVNAHQKWTLKNRETAMRHQQIIGILIFIVAVGLVAVGVVFAWMQFRIAMRYAKTGEPIPASTIKASMGSIEISSSILGIIILALSLVFFYLYLRYVFPLTLLR